MPRQITLTEAYLVERLSDHIAEARRLGKTPMYYESRLNDLIAIARPQLLASPPAPLSPGASAGAAASPIPAGGGNPLSPSATDADLFTGAGLREALHQMWADIGENHFQPDQHNWAEDAFAYLTRQMARQSDQAALDAARKAVAA
jgi:hypothetical protein